MNLSKLLIDGTIYSAVASIYLFSALALNPRWFLQDYPADILAPVPPKTEKEKRMGLWVGIPFLLILFGGPLLSTLSLKALSGGDLAFGAAALHSGGVAFVFNLVDLLILDWLIFCVITPDFIVVPGTKGMAGYKNYRYHFNAFLKGTALSVVLGLVLGAIAALL